MPKAKSSPVSNPPENKQVITMPDVNSLPAKKSVVTAVSPNPADQTPDLEGKIRLRAYELYVERGYTTGFDQQDWLQAERELLEPGRRQKDNNFGRNDPARSGNDKRQQSA